MTRSLWTSTRSSHLPSSSSSSRESTRKMVNTRRTGSGSDQQEQNNQGTGQPLPMPPPLTPEQFFQLQMQMMATLNNIVQALQQIHAQPPPPPPPQPRDRRADFLRGHPPTFSHATDPL
ncbi:hypothetical protein PAHAL_1G178800 [Panicum hallii]|uniref:Uncharacterized protein n=1 Tax=Panicum hallii TaxID=206008 RepID=A0A2T8KVK6_9POAL|nr:hypothetical protein PAHAL_1G178800 [Panicum hallii]